MSDATFRCPRRDESGFEGRGPDHWRPDESCSYCGGLRPSTFLRLWDEGEIATPTDKDYKVYVSASPTPTGKTYFQHFDEGEKWRFIELLNAGRELAYPGRFYVLPFFVRS